MDEKLDSVEVAIALRLTRRARLIVKERFEALRAIEGMIFVAFDGLNAAKIQRLFRVAAADPRLAGDRRLPVTQQTVGTEPDADRDWL